MSRTTTSKAVLLLAATSMLALGGCSEDGGTDSDNGPAGGKADEVDDLDPQDFACARGFSDQSRGADAGTMSSLERLASLNDPFARGVLKATANGCAATFETSVKKLNTTEDGCSQKSAIVSERGQHQGEDGEFLFDNPGYRVVSERGCSGENSRPGWHMVFSLFGANTNSLGAPPEVMAFDEEKGVFNYYVSNGREWEFHGDSMSAIQGGNRCGNCHDGGGLIMKELDSPWVHWEHFDDIAGSREFYSQFEDVVGSRGQLDGASFENHVNESLEEYTKSGKTPRLMGEVGGQPDVEHLLEPLFCTVEINLQSGGNTGDVTFGTDFFLNRAFATSFDPKVLSSSNSGRVRLPRDVYFTAADAIGQDVTGIPGVKDTKRPLTYPEGSFSDAVALKELISRGVLDEDLVSDVLMVDFTRPLFSDTRCGLLKEAVDRDAFKNMVSADAITADTVRAALVDSLEGSDAEGAAGLVDALKNPEDNADQKDQREAYLTACNERLTNDQDAFVTDLMLVMSNKRNHALEKEGEDPRGPHHIIEDRKTMVATDNADSEGAFFNERCCVGACPEPDDGSGDGDGDGDGGDGDGGDGDGDTGGDGDGDGGEPNQCEARCGTDLEFDDTASCQCDTACMEQEPPDCCPGMICE